jgi:hypothetical protein
MKAAKTLTPRILLKMAVRLCFKGLRDTAVLSTAALLVEFRNIISVVVEDEWELMLAPVVEDSCGLEAPRAISSCGAF